MGASVSSGADAQPTASFVLGPDVRVIDPETHEDVVPGSGQQGVLALGGRNPLGYYKDTSQDRLDLHDRRRGADVDPRRPCHRRGRRVRATCSGRGSVCINTGGEKVFPEEVEEVLKLHPAGARRSGGRDPR